MPENTWPDSTHLPDFGQILANIDSSANPVYEAVVNKPHYMQALFVAQIKGSVWQNDLLEICKFMNTQPNTKPKEKDPAKGKEDVDEHKSAAVGEIQTPPPGAAQSPAKSPTIIPQNLFTPLDNTKKVATTTVHPASPVKKLPASVDHHKAVKHQAATAHQLNADEQPREIVKPQAETIPAG